MVTKQTRIAKPLMEEGSSSAVVGHAIGIRIYLRGRGACVLGENSETSELINIMKAGSRMDQSDCSVKV